MKNTNMNKRSGNDDTRAKLLEDHQDPLQRARHGPLRQKDGSENTDCAGNEDHEQETNAQRNVIVSLNSSAVLGATAAALALARTDTMPVVHSEWPGADLFQTDSDLLNTGVEVAMLPLRLTRR